MAQHRTHSRRTSAMKAGVLAACATLVVTVTGEGSASAAGLTVKPRNANVLGNCTLTVLSINPATVTSHIRIASQGQPNNVLGYSNNVYTQVACGVYDENWNLVALYAPFKNGPTLPTSSINPNVPFSSTYHVCGQGHVKFSNGSDSYTPTVCA